jgi:hypothetical protein
MNGFLIICLVLAALSVLGVLGIGMFSMVKGGEFNKKYGNSLMRWRVILQGATIALLAIAYFTSHNS